MAGIHTMLQCSFILLFALSSKSTGSILQFHPHKTSEQEFLKRGRASMNGNERWNYVQVRENAHMFWWLCYTHATVNYTEAPLIMWLQGGPGSSSTGFGNFQELGPLDINLKPRNTSWVSVANILFVDNPVGTGYSYVTNESAYTTDVNMIAQDLLILFKGFLQEVPAFKNVPFYIFCESYGGKMTSAFSWLLYKAVKAGDVDCNFKGLALGDSWISPNDYVYTWGPYLYATSLVAEDGLAAINQSAMQCINATKQGKFKEATALWSQTEGVVEQQTFGVNFYNILQWGKSSMNLATRNDLDYLEKLFQRHVGPTANDALSDLMNGPIRKKLGIIPQNVTWGGQAGKVFEMQSGDFMKPVIDIVDHLIANTDLQVVVYNGQLDLICDTLGTEKWVQKLSWQDLPNFLKADRKPFHVKGGSVPVGYSRSYKNFTFYWILNAGHMVPADVGEAALEMVMKIISSSM